MASLAIRRVNAALLQKPAPNEVLARLSSSPPVKTNAVCPDKPTSAASRISAINRTNTWLRWEGEIKDNSSKKNTGSRSNRAQPCNRLNSEMPCPEIKRLGAWLRNASPLPAAINNTTSVNNTRFFTTYVKKTLPACAAVSDLRRHRFAID